ncbi:MAG: small multi-drug export protein [bacterium]
MLKHITMFLSGLPIPKELAIIILSMLPISELRGAIPVARTVYKFSLIKSFSFSILGNFLFVIPFLWFLNNLSSYFMKYHWFNRLLTWWFNKVKIKSAEIKNFKFWGLILFVGIPLPMTGAWSGCVAGYLLGMDSKRVTLACIVGILMAGIIVTLATEGLFRLFMIF